MRILAITLACLFMLPVSALAQIDWERFFDRTARDRDTFFPPPPLPPATTIATYDFEGCSADGWTTHDVDAQSPYFHIDNFAGLPAPYVPIAGSKSLWCGARQAGSDPLCAYATLPGYGNAWVQYWTTKNCLPVSGGVNVSFAARWDTEPVYDGVWVEFDRCDNNWTIIGGSGGMDGTGSSPSLVAAISSGSHSGNIRVRFRFESDLAWSDEDGLWNTNGAIVIDNLAISDGGGSVLALEDFEGESVGALSSNDWQAGVRGGLGNYTAIFPGASLLQEDPRVTNVSCMWAFIFGSTVNYSCGSHPEQTAVPYVQGGKRIRNEIRSPWIPFTGPSGYSTTLRFQVYRDIPLANLVVYEWWVRERIFPSACASRWMNNNFVYHSDRKQWFWANYSLTPYLSATSSADEIQVALRVVDMAPYWSGMFGTGACHSHAPLFDNVSIRREFGRSYVARSLSLSQDNFPDDGSLNGTVSVNGVDSDFLSIQIADAGAPIDYHVPNNPQSGPAVYLHVSSLPGKSGQIVSGGQQWPVVFSDSKWTVLQMSAGTQPNEYIVDLNDQLYTPGDKIHYYVSSRNQANVTSYWSDFTGETSEAIASTYPMEMACLPTPASQAAASFPTAVEFLYVDGCSGLGAQPLIENALAQMGVVWDRFDRNEALQARANGLGDKAVFQQIAQYNCIIWDTGDIYNDVFTDADFEIMSKYLESKPDARLLLTGDNAARALATSNSPAAANLRANFFNFTLQADDHHNILPAVSPALAGVANSPFDGLSAVAFVGDEGLSHFDVLAPDGSALMGMVYGGNPSLGALLFQQQNTVRTALAGFSLQAVRDDAPGPLPDRTAVLNAVMDFFGKQWDPVGVTPANRSALAQNVPNPFNPTTSIAYSLASAGRVTLRIYDVAGRLVRTLVDDDHAPAGSREATWDGRDNNGATVASGVYFYRLEAGSFVSTKKMLLLK